MNKQQIIAPLVAVGLVALVAFFIFSCNQRREFLRARALAIGKELITTTNSQNVVVIGPGLNERLHEFLARPAHVVSVPLGDERDPIGDGRASVRIFLENANGERLAIRLRPDSDSTRLHIVGYWTPDAAPSR